MEHSAAKIIIADDHTLYREGLRELIVRWEEFDVVGDAKNGREAVELCRTLEPDIALLDVQMPVMDGIEAARIIRSEFPNVIVFMLTMSIEEEQLFEAIRNGAKGYLLKDTPARQLRNCLQGVLSGGAILSGVATAMVLREFNRLQTQGARASVPKAVSDRLTESEIEVLRLVAQGLSNEDIGISMFLSEGTIKKKLSGIMTKLNLENRVQLAVYATRVGLAD